MKWMQFNENIVRIINETDLSMTSTGYHGIFIFSAVRFVLIGIFIKDEKGRRGIDAMWPPIMYLTI